MFARPADWQSCLGPVPPVPRVVALELLWGCNLKCSYCYVGVAKNWQKPVVPKLAELLRLIDRLAQAQVQEVYLVGGEPTAHPHFEQICQHLAQSSIEVRGICTNGTLITPTLADLLGNLNFYVDVSFRGDQPELFDALTGVHGSFRRALRGARLLAEAGISVGIEFDCTPQTFQGLYPLVSLLLEQNIHIHHIFLHRIAPHGDAASLADQGQLTLAMYEAIFAQARQIKAEYGLLALFEDGFPLCLTKQANWEHIVPCECGTFLATVDPQGNVRRCACHEKSLGNLFASDLATIWRETLSEYRSWNWLSEACQSCAVLAQCRGGCAVSAHDCADGFAPDVFSPYFVPIKDLAVLPTRKGILGQQVITLEAAEQ